jgi:hypothetical protein
VRRLFWIGLGATVAVVVVVKGREIARRFTPEGVVEEVEGQVTGLFAQAKDALATFSSAAAERERELTEALLGDRDVEEARRVRTERKARKAWDFDEAAAEDDEDTLGYSFF